MLNLTNIAESTIKTSFLPDYQASIKETEGLGIAIAHHYEWDGRRILETAISALEDANFHTIAGTLQHELDNL